MENPMKIDDLGVPPFKETPIYLYLKMVEAHLVSGCSSRFIFPEEGILCNLFLGRPEITAEGSYLEEQT